MYVGRRVVEMGLSSKRGEAPESYLDTVKLDMRAEGVTKEAGNRAEWRQRICCSNPYEESQKKW